MIKNILIVLLSGFYFLGYSQDKESIYPNFFGKSLESINKNLEWKILVKAEGDLNNDELIDFAIVLESRDSILEKRCASCKLLKQKPRIIIVLVNINGIPNVFTQNNQFIARGDEGGMASYIEPELTIKNGLLSIYYQYTRSNQSYTFEFKNNKMKIVRAESMGVHSATGNYESEKCDFVKMEIVVQTGNISQENYETETIKINIEPKNLSEFGEMYEWEITKNRNL